MSDSYSRTARLAPAIVGMLPALAMLGAAVSSPSTLVRVIGSVAGCVGLLVVAFVRDRGRHVQRQLWDDWGGSPTTRRLRWRDGNPAEVARLHERVQRATGLHMPDAAAESADPADADLRYEEAVAALRELTRDRSRFNLVFKENVHYGWRRNSYGLRPVGIAIAALAAAGASCGLALAGGAFEARAARWGPTLAISLTALAWWTFVVSAPWVRAAADLYADRLFEATHALERDTA